jgi:predicted ribosomally synthesized peptide with SipW-like signal peptide
MFRRTRRQPDTRLDVGAEGPTVGRGSSRLVTRLILTGMLVFGVVSGYAQGPTLAFFTDTATTTSNTFAAGRIELSNTPTTALITLSSMAPGDAVTQPLTIANGGTLPLSYAIASTVTNADSKGLGAVLTLTIKTGVTCTNAGFSSGGTTIYATAALGNIGSSRDIIGTPGSHPNNGRTLNAAANEDLCFQIGLPTSAASSTQGASTTATFAITAEQV